MILSVQKTAIKVPLGATTIKMNKVETLFHFLDWLKWSEQQVLSSNQTQITGTQLQSSIILIIQEGSGQIIFLTTIQLRAFSLDRKMTQAI